MCRNLKVKEGRGLIFGRIQYCCYMYYFYHDYAGLFYDNQTFHDFRVQCPPNTVLHLFVQNSDLSQPGNQACG